MDFPLSELSSNLERQKDLLRLLLPSAPDAPSRALILDRVDSAALKLFRAHLLTSSRDRILSEAVADLEERIGNEGTSDKEVLKLLDEMGKVGEAAEEAFLKTLTDTAIRGNELYLDYKKQVDKISRDVENQGKGQTLNKNGTQSQAGGGGGTQSNSQCYIPILDPVSKLPLTDPVKNKLCGHFYGKNSIRQLIASNSKARCPYPGCENRQYLRNDQLTYDSDMAAKIAAKIKENETQGKDSSTQGGGRNGGGGGGARKSLVELDVEEDPETEED